MKRRGLAVAIALFASAVLAAVLQDHPLVVIFLWWAHCCRGNCFGRHVGCRRFDAVDEF